MICQRGQLSSIVRDFLNETKNKGTRPIHVQMENIIDTYHCGRSLFPNNNVCLPEHSSTNI